MTYLTTAQIVLALIQIYLVWRLLRGFQVLARFNERLDRFGEALTMLTEATEAGFVSTGQELERLRLVPRPALDEAVVTEREGRGRRQSPDIPRTDPPGPSPDARLRLQVADQLARARAATRPRPQAAQEKRDAALR
jgi:hypothetical protein